VALVAMEVLGLRIFEEVRTKRNLSYAAGAGFAWEGALPYGVFYTTPVDPATTVKVMLAQVRRLQNELVPEPNLVGHRSVQLTGLLMEAEATDGQASALAEAQLFGGDWQLAAALPDRLRAVTPVQVRDFAQARIKNLLTVGVGDPVKLKDAQLR
jgi:predicted Zn-dependent peptidase